MAQDLQCEWLHKVSLDSTTLNAEDVARRKSCISRVEDCASLLEKSRAH